MLLHASMHGNPALGNSTAQLEANTLPGVTSSEYMMMCHGASGEQGNSRNRSATYAENVLLRTSAVQKNDKGWATAICLVRLLPSIISTCNVTGPNGVPSLHTWSRDSRRCFRLCSSGAPSFSASSSIADSADALQCGNFLLNVSSFSSFARFVDASAIVEQHPCVLAEQLEPKWLRNDAWIYSTEWATTLDRRPDIAPSRQYASRGPHEMHPSGAFLNLEHSMSYILYSTFIFAQWAPSLHGLDSYTAHMLSLNSNMSSRAQPIQTLECQWFRARHPSNRIWTFACPNPWGRANGMLFHRTADNTIFFSEVWTDLLWVCFVCLSVDVNVNQHTYACE